MRRTTNRSTGRAAISGFNRVRAEYRPQRRIVHNLTFPLSIPTAEFLQIWLSFPRVPMATLFRN
jgi:hypothetical protein